jgi:hypothetical protein
MRARGFPGLLALVLCTVGVAVTTVPAGAATANVCKAAGITRKVATKVLGSGAVAQYLKQYTPTLCEVVPKDYADKGSIEVYLYLKAAYGTQLSGIYPTNHKGYHRHKLHSLGSGAVYVVNQARSVDDVLFVAGGYAVQLQNNEAGGQPKSVYPTEKEYLVLAHAIHSHLR